jgi:hypothetical protein
MIRPNIEDEIRQRVASLSHLHQERVLDFVRALGAAPPSGEGGRGVLRFAGSWPVDQLDEIGRVIEADCEQVDPDAW